MAMVKEVDLSSNSELLSDMFTDLLETIIVDVASESHRTIKLGLDHNLDKQEEELRLSAEARAMTSDPSHNGEANGKYVVDIFGETHPAIASEIFDCMNCGRSVMAGRFAPHLEKCMGKGRKARVKATRSSTAGQNRYSRGSQYSNSTGMNRSSNGSTGDDYSNGNLEEGRKAHVKATGSSTAGQNQYSRGSPYSNFTSMNRSSNGNSGIVGDDYSNGNLEEL